MRLNLDDGYTLKAVTSPDVPDKVNGGLLYSGLPVVSFEYRPALPEALMDYRYKYARAQGGREQLDALAAFVADHLVSWDVVVKGQPSQPTPDVVRHVPEPILTQLEQVVMKWAPKAEEARGN